MRNRLIIFILMIFCTLSNAQNVQWASKVIKFSSDLGGKQNGIKRVLGKPDAFPQAGESANAWTPKNALDGKEFIEVAFEKPQSVKQIAVFENLNAGCVTKIAIDNGSGDYKTVWTRKMDWKTPPYKSTIPTDRSYYYNRKRRKIQEAPQVDTNPGVEYAILEQTANDVVAVKVTFNFALIPGQKQIDAIGISDAITPILATINTSNAFDNLGNTTLIPTENLVPAAPIISFDGNRIFFTDISNPKALIYSCSKQTNNSWSAPSEEKNWNRNTYNFMNAHQPNFAVTGGGDYQSGTNETGFEFYNSIDQQSLGKLKITAYNNYDDTSVLTITNDAKIIVMGIATDMTQGGSDLYFATQNEGKTYGFLQNMGKIINSAADESMPQLLSDQKTLLFASNGFSGYGDYDIFVTYRLDDTWKKWSEPINLGYKINSGSFDGCPFYDEKNEVLYFIKSENGKTFINQIHVPKKALMSN